VAAPVVTTALRGVIRKSDQRVTFLLDKFAVLGHLPEIQTAMSTYAGYNVTIWPILQSLIQLKDLYGDNWETFLGNASVRHFFNVNDNFTADYLSRAMGNSTVTSYRVTATGTEPHSTARPLVTPDEVRRGSGNGMFVFIEQRPPTYFDKKPYYEMEDLIDHGVNRWDDNPYVTGKFPETRQKQSATDYEWPEMDFRGDENSGSDENGDRDNDMMTV
jgi:type IV secretion system protein VirD4